jgi:hypothetical protein
MLVSSKLIFMPAGVSLEHSPYSYLAVRYRPQSLCGIVYPHDALLGACAHRDCSVLLGSLSREKMAMAQHSAVSQSPSGTYCSRANVLVDRDGKLQEVALSELGVRGGREEVCERGTENGEWA